MARSPALHRSSAEFLAALSEVTAREFLCG
jgi:hypothetical protein